MSTFLAHHFVVCRFDTLEGEKGMLLVESIVVVLLIGVVGSGVGIIPIALIRRDYAWAIPHSIAAGIILLSAFFIL